MRRDTTPAKDADVRRQRLILYGLASSGVILLAAVVLGFALLGGDGGGGDSELRRTMEAAGCTLQTFPSQGRNHVQNLNAKFDYNSSPPTSGPHYFQPAIFDLYDRPVNQVQAIHNLEHGGIVIQYGSRVPDATVNQIVRFYRSDPNGVLVAPLPSLGNRVAMTAWTHLGTCTAFNEEAFSAFRDAYRGRGPENFPLDDLEPGE
jgi:Protein of unknown function (DUF3105)